MRPEGVSERSQGKAEDRLTLWYAFLISVLVAVLEMPRTSVLLLIMLCY